MPLILVTTTATNEVASPFGVVSIFLVGKKVDVLGENFEKDVPEDFLTKVGEVLSEIVLDVLV